MISHLDLRDAIRELATCYEQVASLDVADVAGPNGGLGLAGVVPPGVWEIVVADEIARALAQLDEHAEAWCHMLLDDDVVDAVPDLTPARLRLAAAHAQWFVEETWIAQDLDDEVFRLLRRTRNLAERGDRRIHTGHPCTRTTCHGQLVSTLGDTQDGSLACDTCSARVPWETWRRWPQRVAYITAEHAANILRCTTNAVYLRASRGRWRRVGSGRDVRYSAEDVRAAVTGG